jgi:hypothetical protein
MPFVSLRLNDIIEVSERVRALLSNASLDEFEATGKSSGSWNAASRSSRKPAAISPLQ